jgi:hypothetical protein
MARVFIVINCILVFHGNRACSLSRPARHGNSEIYSVGAVCRAWYESPQYHFGITVRTASPTNPRIIISRALHCIMPSFSIFNVPTHRRLQTLCLLLFNWPSTLLAGLALMIAMLYVGGWPRLFMLAYLGFILLIDKGLLLCWMQFRVPLSVWVCVLPVAFLFLWLAGCFLSNLVCGRCNGRSSILA